MSEIKGAELSYEKAEVDKLLLQYKRYMDLDGEINKPSFVFSPNAREERLNLMDERDRLSDDMKFQNPIIWLWYKAVAYIKPEGNKNETVGDFQEDTRTHQICGARILFLEKYLKKTLVDEFGPGAKLIDVAKSKRMQEVVADREFMAAWKKFENMETNGKADKWYTNSFKNYKNEDERGREEKRKLLIALGI